MTKASLDSISLYFVQRIINDSCDFIVNIVVRTDLIVVGMRMNSYFSVIPRAYTKILLLILSMHRLKRFKPSTMINLRTTQEFFEIPKAVLKINNKKT